MTLRLEDALRVLKDHETELRRRGVVHAGVFGSVARNEAGEASDVDVLIELDEAKPLDLFDYANIKLFVAGLFGVDSLDGPIDVVNRKTLKPLIRDQVLKEAVDAF